MAPSDTLRLEVNCRKICDCVLATIIRVGRQQTKLKDDALTGKSEDEILFNKCAIIYPFLWKSHAFQTTCAICMGAPVQKIEFSRRLSHEEILLNWSSFYFTDGRKYWCPVSWPNNSLTQMLMSRCIGTLKISP